MVTFAGTGINLALGILYTWSIFKGAIKQSIESGGEGTFDWDLASINDPYAVCCLVFAFSMILAGKCQDKIGPRITALIGGILVGLGFIWISQTTGYISWVLGFGVLVGVGLGFGYSSATPPALKWFPPSKTGLIAGLVVSGFGLASVYIAPLSKYLLTNWSLQNTMLFFGVAFLFVVCGLSMLLVDPPPHYVSDAASWMGEKKVESGEKLDPRGLAIEATLAGWVPDEAISSFPEAVTPNQMSQIQTTERDFRPSQMMKTANFYMLWFIYFIGAGAGLMVIGSVAGMAKISMGEMAFLVVAIMAIGNAGGRIFAGFLSDNIGRSYTLIIMLCFQALLMFLAPPIIGSESGLLIVLLATFIGFNYGTNLSLFPSFAKDLWGLRNFGINYGIVFTAWGVGGFALSRFSQMLKVSIGSYTPSFMIAAVALIIGAFLTFKLESHLSREKE